MKHHATKFEDYVIKCETKNYHKELEYLNYYKNTKNLSNLIFYGPSGSGKYTQSLNFIKKFSPTNLRFERKINFDLNKKKFIIKVSDIHFEIDMQLLGCNAKLIFNKMYYHILDILTTKSNKTGIILCKNFNYIHNELLDVFYSYMQNLKYKNLNLIYIILTEHVSFIPNNILNKCNIIPVKSITKSNFTKFLGNKKTNNIKKIRNIKNIESRFFDIPDINYCISKKITNLLINYKDINFLNLREKVYDMFVFNLNIFNCIYTIINLLIENNYINDTNIDKVSYKLYPFLKLYNNNYRPIYHFENFLTSLCIIIHNLDNN